MSPGVKWGGTLVFLFSFISYLFTGFLLFGTALYEYKELLVIASVGLIAWILAIRMNQVRRTPDKKFKLRFPFTQCGEMLGPSDRHHLFWMYLSVALLLSVGSLIVAVRVYLE